MKSDNQINKFHIWLENRMTPSERNVFLNLVRSNKWGFPPWGPLRLWFEGLSSSRTIPKHHSSPKVPLDPKLLEWIRRLDSTRIKTPPEARIVEWRRRYIQPSVSLFQSSHSTDGALIVSFTGMAQRMMMSMPDYLDAVSNLEADVLVLRASDKFGYLRNGIKGLDPDLLAGIESIGELAGKMGYAVQHIIGTSAGGLPAVVAMSYFPAASALSVGPQQISNNLVPDSWRARIRSIGQEKLGASLLVLVGENAPVQDHLAADELREATASRTLVVRNAGHGPLRALLDKHFLSEFI